MSTTDYSNLFAKETPPAPPGSSDADVQLVDLWYKKEHEIFIRFQGHPRILRYHGWDIKRGLLFDDLPNGDLLQHLLKHHDSPPSLSHRLQWACDITEGLAFVHSRAVIWVDVNLQNVLLSDNGRAVLCDFAGSCLLNLPGQARRLPFEYLKCQILPAMVMRIPPYPHAKIWEGPGSPYPYPDWNWTPHFDRFSLGIILFCLVALRFPHSPYLFPRDIDEQYKIYQLHQSETFDTLGEVPEYKAFEAITQKCFRAQYPSTDEVLKDLKAACAAMVSYLQL